MFQLNIKSSVAQRYNTSNSYANPMLVSRFKVACDQNIGTNMISPASCVHSSTPAGFEGEFSYSSWYHSAAGLIDRVKFDGGLINQRFFP